MNQLAKINGSPLVGGILAKCTMSSGKESAKPFPLENVACGIEPTFPNKTPTAREPEPTYWLKVNNSKRQSKWKKVYFDDDE
jgi:hypothetical protein